MRLDYNAFLLAQARTGKTLSELGLCRDTISRLRNGGRTRPQTIHRIAKALDVDPKEIILYEKRGM